MRRVCVATGTRAEYGLLYWLMKEIQAAPALELRVLVTGAHLLPAFGSTWRTIEEDGFTIDAKVDMVLANDTPAAVTRSLGLGVIGAADALERLRPDVLVLLGDRYEMLAVAQAALLARVPIAHLHGGERTEGVVDEAIRHAITKMSHLHFVAAEDYRRRVIQLGESPDRVFTVGAMAADNLRRLPLLDRGQLAEALEFEPGDRFFMVTIHPDTLSSGDPAAPARALVEALDHFPEARVILTGVNADPGNRPLLEVLEQYALRHGERVLLRSNLGQLRYLSALRLAAAVIGNSSSGIIEAPALGTPTVNIGWRQRGRLRAASVVDCEASVSAIVAAIHRALSPEMAETLRTMTPIHGTGAAARLVRERLESVKLDGILFKEFHDLPGSP